MARAMTGLFNLIYLVNSYSNPIRSVHLQQAIACRDSHIHDVMAITNRCLVQKLKVTVNMVMVLADSDKDSRQGQYNDHNIFYEFTNSMLPRLRFSSLRTTPTSPSPSQSFDVLNSRWSSRRALLLTESADACYS